MDENLTPKETIEKNAPPKLDKHWKCHLFGFENEIVVTPLEGKVPNFFWRWMQYLLIGNKWIRNE